MPYGLWGMYWRYCLVMSVFILMVAFIDHQFGLFRQYCPPGLQPALFWLILVLCFALATVWQNKGAVYLCFGARLQLKAQTWRQFNRLVLGLCGALALSGFIGNLLFNEVIWPMYKLYVQPAVLLLAPLPLARLVLHSVTPRQDPLA